MGGYVWDGVGLGVAVRVGVGAGVREGGGLGVGVRVGSEVGETVVTEPGVLVGAGVGAAVDVVGARPGIAHATGAATRLNAISAARIRAASHPCV
jgi:hypothetical protein